MGINRDENSLKKSDLKTISKSLSLKPAQLSKNHLKYYPYGKYTLLLRYKKTWQILAYVSQQFISEHLKSSPGLQKKTVAPSRSGSLHGLSQDDLKSQFFGRKSR